MHTNNLGLYLVIIGEGLIILAEHRVFQWHCSLDEAMGHLYQDFRSWTQATKVSCSHRRWRWKHLHTQNSDGVPTFPWLCAKAYNARVILAWLAVELSQGLQPMLMQRPGEAAGDFANRKQLWSIGIATVSSFAEWQRLTEEYPYYLTATQAQGLHDLGKLCLHMYHLAAAVAAMQGKLRWLVLPKLQGYAIQVCLITGFWCISHRTGRAHPYFALSPEPAELQILSSAWKVLSALDDDTVLGQQRGQPSLARSEKAYTTDATLHISFGPLAKTAEKLISLPNPAILHGQGMVAPFWNATRSVLGFEDMHAYEETGEYASSAMVLDDDTVIVSSPFAFNSNLGKVTGQMMSEMWVRKEKEWKLKSTMMQFQAIEAKSPGPAKSAEGTTTQPQTSQPSSDTTGSDSGDVNNTISVSADTGNAVASEGHGTFLAGLTVLVVASVAAVMVRRARNRRAAAISGFESMLG
ncbi:Kinase D-interacting substrate of 220 kDa [Durusdinium trenchii]|uniref:Kinase D-interacting substrate of 220 kDa n=1 Tax=Durusdinium trenchii TaxID=1381693 RepID=A0ABP0M9Y8_9DINO